MNLITYFKFYYRLTNKRILLVIAFAFISSMCQSFALAAMSAVSEYGSQSAHSNSVSKAIYGAIALLSITDHKIIFGILLAFAAFSFIMMSMFLVFASVYAVELQNRLYVKIQQETLNALLNVKYEYFSSASIGYLQSIIVRQLRVVSGSFQFFTSIIVQSFAIIPFLFISVAINLELSLILSAALLPLVFPMMWINKKTKKYSILNVDYSASLNSIMVQFLNYYKYLKATGRGEIVLSHISGIVKRINRITIRSVFLSSLNSNAIVPAAISIICVMVYWQVAIEGVPIVRAAVVLGLLYMASTRLSVLPVTYQKFLSSAGAILSYEDLTKELSHNAESEGKSEKIDFDYTKPIEFKNVSFRYNKAVTPSLSDISFTIEPNTSIAFVGGSGVGKSTLANIIAGLLPPTSGVIKVFGIDYSLISLASYRKMLGYVTQESVIFKDSAANNITLWDNSSDLTAITASAKSAHAHDFISELSEGYDTELGDNGVNLSGGQRQRISIAREFYRNTPLLILDEATSALDSETEHIIQESITELHGKKTLVIIAHRLSTIKNCDVIYVLDKGKIVEQGSYDELISKNGLFKEMVARQAL